MAYQVIARKYRPQRFSDVVGQDHVTQTLANAIASHRVAHAYLFCGPRGTGKTTIARIFAKCLNCTGGPSVDFSDEDPRCKEIAEGRSLDVLEIDAASNRGIDEIRGLRETVRYAPASSKHKIYIIDEVHMLTKEAFNALLKTLEEPPEHVKFMFATTEPEKVLATILSRCQRFDLRRIPAVLIVKHLAQIAEQEGVKVGESALYAIARGAEGGMRDAESTLDQLISFCGSTIEESDVLSMFGLTAQAQIFELADAILAGSIEAGLKQINTLAASGKDLARLLSDVLEYFRNVLIYRISRGDTSMIEASESEIAALARHAESSTVEGLTRILEIFGEAEMRLRDAASKKILIEVAMLKAIENRNAVSIDSVLKKLEELRGDQAGIASTPDASPARVRESASPAPPPRTPKAATAATVAPSVVAESSQPTGTGTSRPRPDGGATAVVLESGQPTPPSAPASRDANLDELWEQLVAAVGRVSPFTRTYLLEAHPVGLSNTLLTIGFPAEHADHIGLVDNPRNQALLQAQLSQLGRPGLQIKFIKAERPPGMASPRPARSATTPHLDPKPPVSPTEMPSRPTPTKAPQAQSPSAGKDTPGTPTLPMSKEAFKNDPDIKRALEIFKGQIVEVRI